MDTADFDMGEGPRFFKVITENTLRDGELEITEKLRNKCGVKLPRYVSLKDSIGQTWKVKLLHCDGKIWFKDGLKDFMDHFSLREGQYLFFKYDKQNSMFDVIIMDDKTGLEIDNNPLEQEFDEENIQQQTETEVEVEAGTEIEDEMETGAESEDETEMGTEIETESESESEESIQKLDDFSPFQEARGKSPLAFSESQASNTVQNSTARNGKGGKGNGYIHKGKQRLDRRYEPTKAEAKVIPKDFSRLHFKPKKGEALLSVDAKTWDVKYFTSLCGGYESTRLGLGWKKFTTDNHLEVDDVCVFELINRTKIELKVTIFRHGEGSKKKKVLK